MLSAAGSEGGVISEVREWMKDCCASVFFWTVGGA